MSWKFVILVAVLNIAFSGVGLYALVQTFGWISTLGLIAASAAIGMLCTYRALRG